MQAFEIADIIAEQKRRGLDYFEFLKVPDLSVGIYALPAGGIDGQSPHSEDEIYYVLSGRASVLVGEENRDVSAGTLVYVPAHVEHRFHSIVEELWLLVIFAPAEYTNASHS